MSYTALYRKWRPRTFSDVKGQDPIVTTLKNEVKLNRIGHAYLFCGTRGTGKTSVAKIFARAVNCEHPVDGEPCGECATCLSILEGSSVNMVEIDAASNNGVDNIRDIRDEVQYRPSTGRYRVYIIDEVHMLSTGAFNALLKTLEEPPEYVIFILATTEPHKIPITVLSRCQRYDFRRIPSSVLAGRLKEICDEEHILIEEKALHYLAMKADGSMRDAISLLDECVAFHIGETLTHEMALQVLGTADNEVYSNFLRAIIEEDTTSALLQVEKTVMDGRDITQFTQDFVWYMRNLLLLQTSLTGNELMELSPEDWTRYREEGESISTNDLMRLIRVFSALQNQLRSSAGKRVAMDVAVIRATHPEMEPDMDSVLSRIDGLERELEELKKRGVNAPAYPNQSGSRMNGFQGGVNVQGGLTHSPAQSFVQSGEDGTAEGMSGSGGDGVSGSSGLGHGSARASSSPYQAGQDGGEDADGNSPKVVHLPPAQAADLVKLRAAWKQIVEKATTDPVFRIDLKNAWLEPKGEGEVYIVSNDYIHGNFIKGKLPELKDALSEAAGVMIGRQVDFDIRVDQRAVGESVIAEDDDDIKKHFVGIEVSIED
ncbi:MAG: DNA polymerase III subunit gamma/tau [Lachnospiraceae bacterium]|nr:DNA polymerase III subunit gamma/tau [Lachnospiraceae bacterium]